MKQYLYEKNSLGAAPHKIFYNKGCIEEEYQYLYEKNSLGAAPHKIFYNNGCIKEK